MIYDQYSVNSINASKDWIEKLLFYVKIAIMIAIVVSLFLVIIQLFNNIHYRTKDIAIMKSIGGSVGEILKIFIYETAVLCVLASIISLFILTEILRLLNDFIESSYHLIYYIGSSPFEARQAYTEQTI